MEPCNNKNALNRNCVLHVKKNLQRDMVDDRDWNCILFGAKTVKMCYTLIQYTKLGEKNMQFDKYKIVNNPVLSSDFPNLNGKRMECNGILLPINW